MSLGCRSSCFSPSNCCPRLRRKPGKSNRWWELLSQHLRVDGAHAARPGPVRGRPAVFPAVFVGNPGLQAALCPDRLSQGSLSRPPAARCVVDTEQPCILGVTVTLSAVLVPLRPEEGRSTHWRCLAVSLGLVSPRRLPCPVPCPWCRQDASRCEQSPTS